MECVVEGRLLKVRRALAHIVRVIVDKIAIDMVCVVSVDVNVPEVVLPHPIAFRRHRADVVIVGHHAAATRWLVVELSSVVLEVVKAARESIDRKLLNAQASFASQHVHRRIQIGLVAGASVTLEQRPCGGVQQQAGRGVA